MEIAGDYAARELTGCRARPSRDASFRNRRVNTGLKRGSRRKKSVVPLPRAFRLSLGPRLLG